MTRWYFPAKVVRRHIQSDHGTSQAIDADSSPSWKMKVDF
jgi:hypothetical protein